MVDVADFNQDGNVDVVYGSYDEPAPDMLCAAAGSQTPAVQTWPWPLSPKGAHGHADRTHKLQVAGDLNLDGRTEFLWAQFNSCPQVYMSVEDFHHVLTSLPCAGSALVVVSADVFGTGVAAVVQGGFYGGAFGVYANSGNGVLASCQSSPASVEITRWRDIVGGDLDADGLDDIVGTTSGGHAYTFLSIGGGVFVPGPPNDAAGVIQNLADSTSNVQLADVDNNGTLDLVVGSYGNVYLLRNDGKAAFTLSQALSVPQNDVPQARRSPAVGDLNGDGFLDLVVGSLYGAPHVTSTTRPISSS